MTVAALFVQTGGAYFGLEGVEPWDESRDARKYTGPWPVVAHPPCQRWGRYWFGGPSVKVRKTKGDDSGCFGSALESLRRFGGVLEHPAGSSAWAHFQLNTPPERGWVNADFSGLWTCRVEQGNYGHPARKATWLLASRVHLPELKWGASSASKRLDEGFHSTAERKAARALGVAPLKRLTESERIATPVSFRDLLLSIARGVR